MGLGIAAWGLSGCLIPQDEAFLSEVPIPRNRPPRIVEKQVQPSERIIRGYGSDFCGLEFSVIVEDPDVGDVLTANWFIDYDPSLPRGADRAVRLEPSADGNVVRDERAYFQPNFNSAAFDRLNVPGDHIIEVLVADSALVGRDPQPTVVKLPDGQDFSDPGYTASYVWFVRTEAGTGCL
ncbi:hypothetical protein [Archangium primigenium]|uniref:hypothetical protein n=1 Tax=[Archangium] primigenium TaxID=2792470 RepID=UPI00195636B6|nr:hypothetical protein [Archangium primigenium]MBM7115954.1 hypothetical protein [Archangium primigenium]